MSSGGWISARQDDVSETGMLWNSDGMYTTEPWSILNTDTPVGTDTLGSPGSTGNTLGPSTPVLTQTPASNTLSSVSVPTETNSTPALSTTPLSASESSTIPSPSPSSPGTQTSTSTTTPSSASSPSSTSMISSSRTDPPTTQSDKPLPSNAIKKSNTGLIAGLVVGLSIAFIIIVLAVVFFRRRRAHTRNGEIRSKSLSRSMSGMDAAPLLANSGGSYSAMDPFSGEHSVNGPLMTGLAAEYYNEGLQSPAPSTLDPPIPRYRMTIPKPGMDPLEERPESGYSSVHTGYSWWLTQPVQELLDGSNRSGSPEQSTEPPTPNSAGPLTRAFQRSERTSSIGSIFSLESVLGRATSVFQSSAGLAASDLQTSCNSRMPEYERASPQDEFARHASLAAYSVSSNSHSNSGSDSGDATMGSHTISSTSQSNSSNATLGSHDPHPLPPPRLAPNRVGALYLTTGEYNPVKDSTNVTQLTAFTPNSESSFSPGFRTPGAETSTDAQFSTNTTDLIWSLPSPPPLPSVLPLNIHRTPSTGVNAPRLKPPPTDLSRASSF